MARRRNRQTSQALSRLAKQVDAAIKSAEQKMADAVQAFRPAGWRRAVRILREIGPLATISGVIVALLALTAGALYQSFAHVKEETQFRTRTEDRLAAIESSLLALRTKAAVSDPSNQNNQIEIKNVLATAKRDSVALPLSLVQDGGEKYVEAAKNSPTVWGAAL